MVVKKERSFSEKLHGHIPTGILAGMKKAPSALEQYGRRAKLDNVQEIAGRFGFQKKAEQYLLLDLVDKLSLTPEDDVLEIGCAAGNLLIPLSFFVRSMTGIDHKDLLRTLKSRLPKEKNITLIPGNFLDVKVSGSFSRILIYSVIHYLKDEAELEKFIRKAVAVLRPGGKILIGDIPNMDRKRRFLRTTEGKKFDAHWRTLVKNNMGNNIGLIGAHFEIGDDVIARLLRLFKKLRLHAQVLRQPKTHAFSHTREDILAERR